MTTLHCKAIGHSWDLLKTPHLSRRKGQVGYKLYFRCVNCGSDRVDTVNIYGRVMFRSYHYSWEYTNSQKMTRDNPYTVREQYRSAYIKSLKE